MMPEPPVSLWPDPESLGLLTDLYQLTMMAGYMAAGRGDDRATFEMFVRRLPPGRSYLVFAGLEQVVGDLLRLRLTDRDVNALRTLPAFARADPKLLEPLRTIQFTGDVWAVPEGTVVFAGEPLIRVEARLPEAQWLETLLLASIGYSTLVASKAARVVEAASGRPVHDFGLRRGHGAHAGMLAARAAYLAGFAGTSNVEAAIRLGIPCSGTMAHSWVQTFDNEAESFSSFARYFPDSSIILVDTYDTPRGVCLAAEVEPPIQGVRIDSGDLGALAIDARSILDSRGLASVKIFGSGDLDEFRIAELLATGAPFDAFGVGTEVVTSRDAPALSIVYKLVAIDGKGRIKLSTGKKTYPLGKQVYRTRDPHGRFAGDQVTRSDETSDGEPLLIPVIREGRLVAPLPRLDAIREHCRAQCGALPEALRGVRAEPLYPISYSDGLEIEAKRLGVK